MGRRHLSLGVAAAVAALLGTAAAGSAADWHRLASDPPNDAKVKRLSAYVAGDARSARAFSGELTYSDPGKLSRVDFRRDLVVAVFEAPTCKPHLPSVKTVSQHGQVLAVEVQGPAPEASNCHPRWPGGYELIVVPKSGLAKPYPTRATARYA